MNNYILIMTSIAHNLLRITNVMWFSLNLVM